MGRSGGVLEPAAPTEKQQHVPSTVANTRSPHPASLKGTQHGTGVFLRVDTSDGLSHQWSFFTCGETKGRAPRSTPHPPTPVKTKRDNDQDATKMDRQDIHHRRACTPAEYVLADARHAAPLMNRRNPQRAHVVVFDDRVVRVPERFVHVGVAGVPHAGQGAVRVVRPEGGGRTRGTQARLTLGKACGALRPKQRRQRVCRACV